MQVRYLSWIFVFVLLVSSVYAVEHNFYLQDYLGNPVNNYNLSLTNGGVSYYYLHSNLTSFSNATETGLATAVAGTFAFHRNITFNDSQLYLSGMNITLKSENTNDVSAMAKYYYSDGSYYNTSSVSATDTTYVVRGFENSSVLKKLKYIEIWTTATNIGTTAFVKDISIPYIFKSNNLSINVSFNYNVFIDYSGYSFFNNSLNTSINGSLYSLLPNNAINISIFKESDGTKLYGNASLSFVGDSGIVFYDTINQTKLYSSLTSDNYSIGFTQSGYALKSYRVNLVDRTFNILNVYLNNGSSVLFNFKTNTGTVLSGVELQVYTVVNGSNVLVESSSSDITGKVQIALESSKYYSFIATKSGYNDYSFILNPVLFTSYDVVMTPSGSGSTVIPSAIVTFTPTSFYRFQNVNFNIQFVSQYNNLVNYSYNVSYPSSSVAGSGSNSHGSTLNSSFTLNPSTIVSNVSIFYQYYLSNGVYYNATYVYPIVYTYSNRTWVTMGNSVNATTGQDSVTGYFVGERVLIVTFISLIMFGVGWVIGGAVPGLVFAIIPIMFFVNSGFVPKQLYYITFFFMVIYFIGRGSDS